MQIKSTNLGSLTKISWNGREGETGLYKFPVNTPIFLGIAGVQNDCVANLSAHGGRDKACYLFSAEDYHYWKGLYPDLDWQWGMFGENLTISGIDVSILKIGDKLHIGETVVQVSQPRQPCWKLEHRFNSSEISKQFIACKKTGAYVRVLQEGYVKAGDSITVTVTNNDAPDLQEVFDLLYHADKNSPIYKKTIQNTDLAERCRQEILNKAGQK